MPPFWSQRRNKTQENNEMESGALHQTYERQEPPAGTENARRENGKRLTGLNYSKPY